MRIVFTDGSGIEPVPNEPFMCPDRITRVVSVEVLISDSQMLDWITSSAPSGSLWCFADGDLCCHAKGRGWQGHATPREAIKEAMLEAVEKKGEGK